MTLASSLICLGTVIELSIQLSSIAISFIALEFPVVSQLLLVLAVARVEGSLQSI